MRLAIFGVPRSGTSLLFETISPYFDYSLNEPFPPGSKNHVIERNGQLYKKNYSRHAANQSRDERLLLLKKYLQHDYFTKVFPHDISYLPIFDWLMEREYRFIAIERKRPIDALISIIIARETKKGSYKPDEDIIEIEPMVVDIKTKWHWMIDAYRIYYEFVDSSPVAAIHRRVFYEDISNMTIRGEILEAVGLSELLKYPIFDDRTLPLRKPRTEENKRKLIANMPELVDWYQEKMMPILPDRAKQFDLNEYRKS